MMTIPISMASSFGFLFYLFVHATICSSSSLNVGATTSVDLSGGNAAAEVIVKDFTNHQFATKGLPHPSEQCLTTSVAMMTQWSSEKTRDGIADSGKHYCASMTVEQRELLALELTNCQLLKQQRSIFRHRKFSDLDQDQSASLVSGDSTGNDDDHIDDGSIEKLCPIGTLSAGSPYKPTNCLPFLSEYASLIYNQFYLYTDEICGRLTESLIIQHKEEVSRMLVNASSSVAQHIQLQSILLKDHSLAMQEQQSQLQRIYESRKLQEEEVLHIIQTNYLQMKEQFLVSKQIFRERERESEQMYLRTLSDLEKMLEMISKASSHIQLLSSIESFVFAAISGLSVLKSFVVFILFMNVAWILTALTSTQRARRYIAGIVTAEFFLEVSIVLLVDSPVLFGLDDEILIKLARYLAWGSCGLVLSSFLVASFFMTYPKDDFEAMSVEDFLQKQISELSNLNEARGLALACRAMGNNLDVGRERLENRFNQYHRKPRYQIRRYKPRHRTISDRGLPVVTPAKQKRTPSPGLLPTSDQVQDPFSFSTKRTSKPINHREHINMNDTSDSNYVNSSSDESSDSENYETLESKTVIRKRKLSNLESSNEDDDSFMSTRSSFVSTQNSVETKGESVSSITMGDDFSHCGKRRKETRD